MRNSGPTVNTTVVELMETDMTTMESLAHRVAILERGLASKEGIGNFVLTPGSAVRSPRVSINSPALEDEQTKKCCGLYSSGSQMQFADTTKGLYIDLVNPKFKSFNRPLLLAIFVGVFTFIVFCIMCVGMMQACEEMNYLGTFSEIAERMHEGELGCLNQILRLTPVAYQSSLVQDPAAATDDADAQATPDRRRSDSDTPTAEDTLAANTRTNKNFMYLQQCFVQDGFYPSLQSDAYCGGDSQKTLANLELGIEAVNDYYTSDYDEEWSPDGSDLATNGQLNDINDFPRWLWCNWDGVDPQDAFQAAGGADYLKEALCGHRGAAEVAAMTADQCLAEEKGIVVAMAVDRQGADPNVWGDTCQPGEIGVLMPQSRRRFLGTQLRRRLADATASEPSPEDYYCIADSDGNGKADHSDLAIALYKLCPDKRTVLGAALGWAAMIELVVTMMCVGVMMACGWIKNDHAPFKVIVRDVLNDTGFTDPKKTSGARPARIHAPVETFE